MSLFICTNTVKKKRGKDGKKQEQKVITAMLIFGTIGLFCLKKKKIKKRSQLA